MISVVHRNEYGFRDSFEGYFFVKDETPFAQLHLYRNYYTFFWLGSAAPESLGVCLGETVREVSRQFGIPFNSISSGVMRLAVENKIEDYTFIIEDDYSEAPRLKVGERGEDFKSFLARGTITPFFARLDVASGKRLPLILWADLADNERAEVGFSSMVDLPSPVLNLLRDTCKVELDEAELKEVSGQVGRWVPARV